MTIWEHVAANQAGVPSFGHRAVVIVAGYARVSRHDPTADRERQNDRRGRLDAEGVYTIGETKPGAILLNPDAEREKSLDKTRRAD